MNETFHAWLVRMDREHEWWDLYVEDDEYWSSLLVVYDTVLKKYESLHPELFESS